MNFSAGVEVEDPIDQGEETEVTGDLALALLCPMGKCVGLLELNTEVAPDATPVLLAPGFYWHTRRRPLDLAISSPIGLDHDAPAMGVFLMAIVEFDAHAKRPDVRKNLPGGRSGRIR